MRGHFRYMQTCNEYAQSFYAYKRDISKAYDRVDWVFLEGMLIKQAGFFGMMDLVDNGVCYFSEIFDEI